MKAGEALPLDITSPTQLNISAEPASSLTIYNIYQISWKTYSSLNNGFEVFLYFCVNIVFSLTFTNLTPIMAKKPTPHPYADKLTFDRIMLLIATLVNHPGIGHSDTETSDSKYHDALLEVQSQLQKIAAESSSIDFL